MRRRRVKITGIGLITPAGIGKEAFKQGILRSISYVAPIRRFDPEAGPFVGSEVKGFRLADHIDDADFKRLPRHTQFALAATKLALADARLTVADVGIWTPPVVLGTSLMDSDVINKTIENVTRKGPRAGLMRVVFQGPVSSIAGAVIEYVGAGRGLSLQSACCASSDAIGTAANMVSTGEAEMAICGGTEAPLFYHPMLELKMAGLSPDTNERPEQLGRPFDLWRTTGVIGEGACVMILEPESSPRAGYAYVSGYAFASDSNGDSGGGLNDAMRLCLANGGVRASEVDFVNAWGPGHRLIDAAEARALRSVFGDGLDQIPVASIKGAIGNPFGAAGAIQVGCTALGMRDGFIPPTVNWVHPDPACRLNLSARPRYIPFTTALVNSHGLSGTNSCLLMRSCN